MEERTYNILLSVLITIIVATVIIGGGLLVYNMVKEKEIQDHSDTIASDLEDRLKNVRETNKRPVYDGLTPEEIAQLEENSNSSGRNTSEYKEAVQTKMENFNVVGLLEIDKIGLKYPVLDQVTKRSLELSVAMLDTTAGVNQIGNTTILGHNYRNNMFFSKNHMLTNGDKIKMTDMTGETVTYEIYQMEYISPNYSTYIRRNTNGLRELSLSTCNDDSTERLLILAREVQN